MSHQLLKCGTLQREHSWHSVPAGPPSNSGAGTNLKVGVAGIFLSCSPHFFGSTSTISRFGERFPDGQYSLVSFLSAVLVLTVSPCTAYVKMGGGTCLWSRRHCTRKTGLRTGLNVNYRRQRRSRSTFRRVLLSITTLRLTAVTSSAQMYTSTPRTCLCSCTASF